MSVPVYRIREEVYQALDYYKIIVMQMESIYSFLSMAQAFARITLKACRQTYIQGRVPNHGYTWTGQSICYIINCYEDQEHGTELEAD